MTMNKEMQDLAGSSIKTALSAGANACRVGIDGRRFVQISYRQRKAETIKEASTRGLNIELFVNGRYSSQSTSDLRKDALKEFIANAVAMTKLLAEDEFRSLPDPKYYEGRSKADLKTLDPDYDGFTPEERHEVVRGVEDGCLAAGGDKVVAVIALGQDTRAESVLMASNGLEAYAAGTGFVAGARCTVQDEGDRRPMGYNYQAAAHRKSLPAPVDMGKAAAARALAMLGAKKIETATLPIIVENQVVPNILDGLLEAMTGRNIQQKQSFLLDKKGQKIAGEKLTLIDDPLLEAGLASQPFDSDGLAAKKRTIIEAGVLKEFFVNWYYSRKLGWEPTTGSPSNLIIPPGTRSVAEIMKDLGKGILVTGFIGGNSNSTTGDASVGIFGHLFENGEIVHAVSEMNIADNHLKFWQRLVEVANDPWMYDSNRTPSLVFTDVVVSGV
jgi:PmbA protein